MAEHPWTPIRVERGDIALLLRGATQADAPILEQWDSQPHVISATTDDKNAAQAFAGAIWRDELAIATPASFYLIAELDGRPIGAMQIIDPYVEPTHYWGEIEPNLRAFDIWIGEPRDLGRGYGDMMMRAVIAACFADPSITAIVIDPLASNTRAHDFYQRLGFKPMGRRLFNGEDDCLVHRLERRDWRTANPKE